MTTSSRRALAAIAALLLAVGCTRAFVEVGSADLGRVFILNSSPTFVGYSYLGSDERHHYFASRWRYGRDRYFSVPKGSMAVALETRLGESETRLSILSQSSADPFCTAGQVRLYRVK